MGWGVVRVAFEDLGKVFACCRFKGGVEEEGCMVGKGVRCE